GYTVWREALVPVDTAAESPRRLLFDHELNAILSGIAQRTRSVTCILDCCHSGGVTRDAGMPDATSRALDAIQHLGWVSPPLPPELTAPASRPPGPTMRGPGAPEPTAPGPTAPAPL